MTDARTALEKCRDTFAEYAELHRHKLTSANSSFEHERIIRKVERNRDMCDLCIAALALMARFHAGEITLEQAQAELARTKRNAKRNGKVTRNQAYLGRAR